MTTKSVAHCGTLTALAMIFGYVEALIPFHFGIPGVKLGLPNIITVFALYTLPVYQVFAIQVMRIVLVSFLFGNLSMMLYSLAGGLLSLAVMGLLKKKKVAFHRGREYRGRCKPQYRPVGSSSPCSTESENRILSASTLGFRSCHRRSDRNACA